MSTARSYLPFSLLSFVAAVIALMIAWEPGQAEAEKAAPEGPVLRTSIIETGGVAAPDCPFAVWPNITKDCLLHPNQHTADRDVRAIVIDDRTMIKRRQELYRLSLGS